MAVGLVLIGHLDGFHGAPIGRLTVLRLARAVLLEFRLARTFLSEYRLTSLARRDSDGFPLVKRIASRSGLAKRDSIRS